MRVPRISFHRNLRLSVSLYRSLHSEVMVLAWCVSVLELKASELSAGRGATSLEGFRLWTRNMRNSTREAGS